MKKDSFQKKLAAYIVMSEAFLLAHPVDADAQIMYTDVNPDLVIHNSYFNLDLNNDGVVDFKLKNGSVNPLYLTTNGGTTTFPGWCFAIENDNINMGSNEIVTDNILSFPVPVSNSLLIDDAIHWGTNPLLHIHTHCSSSWTAYVGGEYTTYFSSWNNNFGNFLGTNKYVGIKLNSGGNTYYGWARLDVYNDSMVLKDYAVNMIPDSSILAGEGSSACAPGNYSLFPNGNQIICADDSADVNVLNTASANVQWLYYGSWINGETDSSLIVSQPGSYAALVSDSNCAVITTGANFENATVYAYATEYSTTCNSPNGSINVTVYGNSPSYLYQWSTGETNEDLHNVPAGDYQLIVTCTSCPVADTLNISLSNYGNIPVPVIYLDSLTLSTGNYDSYQWLFNGIEIQYAYEKYYTANKIGYYQVEVEDYFGSEIDEYCTGISDSFHITNIPGIPIDSFDIYIDSLDFYFAIADKKLVFVFSHVFLYNDQVEIYNRLGQLVKLKTLEDFSAIIDVSDLIRGIYFYYIRTKHKTYRGKFFIE